MTWRHPAEKTAERLATHMVRWPTAFDEEHRRMVDEIRRLLLEIAEQPMRFPATGRYPTHGVSDDERLQTDHQ